MATQTAETDRVVSLGDDDIETVVEAAASRSWSSTRSGVAPASG